MGTVEASLFGAPEIRRDGQPVAVDTRKALAVLAVLAVEGRPVRRDVVAGMLWPDSTQERARASLRRTLSSLRSATGADALLADGETISLAPEACAVDVVAFDALEADDPASAIALYRGDFLEGFSVADSADFESWQRDRAADFRRRLDRLLAQLAEGADPPRTVELSRRRLALDPLNEAACRQLMEAMASVGDRSGAVAAYRDLVSRLEHELGVEPLGETTATYDAVRRGSRSPPPTMHEPADQPAAVSAPPMIGRAAELAALVRASSEPGLVIVSGEPGIGRTRLLSELAERVDCCLALRCHVGEHDVPYAPFAAWIGGPAESAAVALFDDLASALPLPEGGIIAIDDLHLADPATLAFLTYLVHRRERFGWSIVGAWAATEIGPEDACWELLTEGRREGWATEVRLGRLTEADRRALIDALEGAPPARSEQLVQMSEGVPLVIVESMRLGARDETMPPLVRDVMRRRLASVGPLARQIVEALAVVGRPAGTSLLQSVSGRSHDETLSAVDELVGAGLAQDADEATRVMLTHRLLGVVAIDELTQSRRRTLHERAGRALPDAEAAEHLALAGLDAEACAAHVRAAADARSGHALAAALHHLRSAIGFGHDEPAAYGHIGDIETALGHYDAARRAYEIGAARSTGPELVSFELRLARLALRAGHTELAASHLDSAEAELALVPGEEQLGIELAICRTLAAAADVGADPSDPDLAIALAQRGDHPALEAEAHGASALLAHRRGDAAVATDHARRALRLSRLAGAPLVEAAADNLLGLAASAEGRLPEAIACFEDAVAVLRRHGDVHRLAAAHANLADAHHRAGQDRDARRHQLESARLFSEVSGAPTEGHAEVWLLTAW